MNQNFTLEKGISFFRYFTDPKLTFFYHSFISKNNNCMTLLQEIWIRQVCLDRENNKDREIEREK